MKGFFGAMVTFVVIVFGGLIWQRSQLKERPADYYTFTHSGVEYDAQYYKATGWGDIYNFTDTKTGNYVKIPAEGTSVIKNY